MLAAWLLIFWKNIFLALEDSVSDEESLPVLEMTVGIYTHDFWSYFVEKFLSNSFLFFIENVFGMGYRFDYRLAMKV